MPYNPGIQDRSAEYIFQGLSNMGSGIGKGIQSGLMMREKDNEQKKKDKQYLDALDMMREADPEGFGAMFGDKSAYDLGASGSRALMEGYMMKMKTEAYVSGRKQQDALEQQNKQLRKIVNEDPNAPSWAKEMAAGEALTLDNFGKLAEIHQVMGQRESPMGFIEDPKTGSRFFRSGNTTLPSGVNPARTGAVGEMPQVGSVQPVEGLKDFNMIFDGSGWKIQRTGQPPMDLMDADWLLKQDRISQEEYNRIKAAYMDYNGLSTGGASLQPSAQKPLSNKDWMSNLGL